MLSKPSRRKSGKAVDNVLQSGIFDHKVSKLDSETLFLFRFVLASESRELVEREERSDRRAIAIATAEPKAS